MSAIELLNEPPPLSPASAWLLLAHGAGAPMTSPFMSEIAALVAARGIGVSRFEFAYMARRRIDSKREPPPKAERLTTEFVAAIAALDDFRTRRGVPLLIGGKSMGGRVATLAADTLFAKSRIVGAVALGYPFHPPRKPDALRTAHLQSLQTPLLIVQGERDPFGSRTEVESYALAPAISIAWAQNGDHDLRPRRGQGITCKSNLVAAADAIARFATGLIR